MQTEQEYINNIMNQSIDLFCLQLRGLLDMKQFGSIKDSGERAVNPSGMVRDIDTDKINYALALDGPMFNRWATHLTNGAKKYEKRNWMKANSSTELERAKESAARHFWQWYNGDTDEDHASGVYFNINEVEYIKEKLKANPISQFVTGLSTSTINTKKEKKYRCICTDGCIIRYTQKEYDNFERMGCDMSKFEEIT